MADQRVTIDYDATNEAVVLRAAIASKEVRASVTRRVSPSEFLAPGHDAIWRALRAMTDRALEYSPETARQLVKTEGGDPSLLDVLEPGADVPPNFDWHVEVLRWDAVRLRIAKETLPRFVDLLADPKANPDDVASAARAIERATQDRGRSHIRRSGELALAYRSALRERQAGNALYPTGWPALDNKLVEGLAPGKSWAVVGLPGSGKSTFICAFLVKLATLNVYKKILLAPWEMGSESSLDVIAAHVTRIPLARIVRGQLSAEEVDRVSRATDFFARRIVFMENAFFDQSAMERNRGRPDNNRNLDILEGYLAESGCQIAVYDLWERLIVDDDPGSVARALYRQQAMHKSYTVCGVVVQQLRSKDVEKRQDKRPTREAIKGTGAYTEVMDVIFGVHRDAQFKAVPDRWIEAICLKQRKGPVNWAVQFDWDAETCGVSGGEEVPYDPGFDAAMSDAPGDIAGIRTGGGRRRSKGRDDA